MSNSPGELKDGWKKLQNLLLIMDFDNIKWKASETVWSILPQIEYKAQARGSRTVLLVGSIN